MTWISQIPMLFLGFCTGLLKDKLVNIFFPFEYENSKLPDTNFNNKI